jgi:hypothetical protein
MEMTDFDWGVVGAVALVILEVLLRIVPTGRSYSMVKLAVAILDKIVPDNKKFNKKDPKTDE